MNITHIKIELTAVEVRAVYRALMLMMHSKYANDAEADAGKEVYNELTPVVEVCIPS